LGPVLIFCAPGLVFDGTEGVGFRFHVLGSRTRFWRYRGRRVPFSYFALPDSFSAVPSASGHVFMFCAPGLVCYVTEGVGSHFDVLYSRTHFQRYRGLLIRFSCFKRSDSFSAVPRASVPVFMFCAPGLIFGGTEGVGVCFHVLRSWTRFRRYRGRRVSFSFFARPDSFSAVPRASVPVFIFCALCLVFGSTKGVGSRFHILRSQTCFHRGRRVPFSSFALQDSFSAVSSAWGPIFMFCAPELVFDNIEGVGSHFSCFARPDSFTAVPSASRPVFMFYAPGIIFGGTEGVGSLFHVLRYQTHFRRYRGRPIPFSCFARPDSISPILRASGPVFMFCDPGLILGGT
jgi:hypothetical protein